MIDILKYTNNKKVLWIIIPVLLLSYITGKNILNYPEKISYILFWFCFFACHLLFYNIYNILDSCTAVFDKILNGILGLWFNLFIAYFLSSIFFLIFNIYIIYNSLGKSGNLYNCKITSFFHSSKLPTLTIKFQNRNQLLYGTGQRIKDPKAFENQFQNYIVELTAVNSIDSIYVVKDWKIVSILPKIK